MREWYRGNLSKDTSEEMWSIAGKFDAARVLLS
jgi:hypothetical protein